jgi:hypothetical protein
MGCINELALTLVYIVKAVKKFLLNPRNTTTTDLATRRNKATSISIMTLNTTIKYATRSIQTLNSTC